MLSSTQILNAKHVGDIFSNDKTKIKIEYKELSKRWHPDLNGNSKESNDAMAKINELYAKAQVLLDKGEWEKSNYECLKTLDGRLFEINYQRKYDFELGTFYVCPKAVIYNIDKSYQMLYNNYKKVVQNLKFPNDKMKEIFGRITPKINLEFETEKSFVMRIAKEEDVFPLIDIHNFYKQTIPDKHVAWMLSRLYDFECFLMYNNLSHNGLTIESLFVNPEHHGIFIYGGWWFSQQLGNKLIGVPKKVYNAMPFDLKTEGKADSEIDLETIRLIGRQLLGDEFGGKILTNKEIPTPIKEWMLDKAGKKPLQEYEKWNSTLDSGYGKRVFIKMDINKNNIY